jgi:hypothetical protein
MKQLDEWIMEASVGERIDGGQRDGGRKRERDSLFK